MSDQISQDPVDGLLGDARASLARARAAVPPDFAAVVARAQALAGEDSAPIVVASGEPAVEEDDTVVDIRTRARVGTPDGLDGLVADGRAAVERMVERARMRAIPAMPRVRSRRRAGVVVSAVFGLAAAAAAVTFGVFQWSEPARLDASDVTLVQAFRSASDAATRGAFEAPETPPVAPRPQIEPRVPQVSVVTPEIATPSPIAPEPGVASGRPTVRRADLDRLRALSEEARRLWRAGDRGGAESKFLEVTSSGGRSPLAELAWGDLFALARQMGDDARLAKRWRSYVAKFPRGRYADDARAGLCRTSKAPGPCWAAYLRDFPNGSYRAEARVGLPEGR